MLVNGIDDLVGLRDVCASASWRDKENHTTERRNDNASNKSTK